MIGVCVCVCVTEGEIMLRYLELKQKVFHMAKNNPDVINHIFRKYTNTNEKTRK